MFGRRKKQEITDVTSINDIVDFTLIDPRAIEKDIHTLINVAIKNKYYAVCVNSSNVFSAKNYIENTLGTEMPVVATVGFPLGACSLQAKVVEAKQAIADGADELDVVINIGKLKDGDFSYVKNELSRIVRISKGRIVKAIIETCYLNREEIKLACKACEKSKVDFIKTSSGYGTGGATVEDVYFIKECVKGKIAIKASGGIRLREQAEELVRAGATRLGTSRTI